MSRTATSSRKTSRVGLASSEFLEGAWEEDAGLELGLAGPARRPRVSRGSISSTGGAAVGRAFLALTLHGPACSQRLRLPGGARGLMSWGGVCAREHEVAYSSVMGDEGAPRTGLLASLLFCVFMLVRAFFGGR